MLDGFHHCGYIARDLADGVATLQTTFALELAVEFEIPQFTVRGVFLTGGDARIEVFEFTDRALADRRLAGVDLRLDHMAYEVADIDAAVERLRTSGARLCGPDESPLDAPIDLRGARHIWTLPAGAPAVGFQLVQSA